MTESNITKEHEGKHGVLTIGKTQIQATIWKVYTRNFDAGIDGSDIWYLFSLHDVWQFTPDPDPLPVEDGWYYRDVPHYHAPVLYVHLYGEWSVHYSNGVDPFSTEEMVALHDESPLIRINFGE